VPLVRTPRKLQKIIARVRSLLSLTMHHPGAGAAAFKALVAKRRAAQVLKRASSPLKLCLGSGSAPLAGWINIDIQRPADVLLDLRFGIPLADGSVAFIYSEHLIEHLTLDEGLAHFAECRRLLKPGGVLRIATPDLADLVKNYATDWRRHDWVRWPGNEWIDTGTRMLNMAVRDWGHQYMYDYDELNLRLSQAGFESISRAENGMSAHPELCGLETRADSKLVAEAQRLDEPASRTMAAEQSMVRT
jgi:predicted SAM-dependent methyltransferase